MFRVNINSVYRKDTDKNTEIIKDINFNIECGKIYTILGKNGSGKTTLIKSLTRLLDSNVFNTSGKVFWNNEDVFLMNRNRIQEFRQKEVRYVLQDLSYNFDPLKKLKYYFKDTYLNENILSDILKSFLLPEFKIISKLYSYEISGGMAQRLSLMLALLPIPKLVILDEPTSAIDYTNINLVKIKLKEFISGNNSALIVTQDIKFAKDISDNIAFLSDGKLSHFQHKDLFFKDEYNMHSQFINAYEHLK
jgi:ABC-type multidrug transport system ATPase subunit